MNARTRRRRARSERQLALAATTLRLVLHRITDTVAEDWVAPNPRASERCAMCQYHGTLADLIFATLQAIGRNHGTAALPVDTRNDRRVAQAALTGVEPLPVCGADRGGLPDSGLQGQGIGDRSTSAEAGTQ